MHILIYTQLFSVVTPYYIVLIKTNHYGAYDVPPAVKQWILRLLYVQGWK